MNEIQKIIIASSFSWEILLTILSVIGTFIASAVALYLGYGYRHIIIKISGYKIDEHTFEKKGSSERNYQKITIYNASQRKVRLQEYGFFVDKEKYTPDNYRIIYDLVRPIKKEADFNLGRPGSHTIYDAAYNRLPFYILDGEDCRFGLFPGDYSFDKDKMKKRLYVYVKINEKIKKYFTGLTLEKYLSLTAGIDEKTS